MNKKLGGGLLFGLNTLVFIEIHCFEVYLKHDWSNFYSTVLSSSVILRTLFTEVIQCISVVVKLMNSTNMTLK
jgi:uncharacterized integral membrane protein